MGFGLEVYSEQDLEFTVKKIHITENRYHTNNCIDYIPQKTRIFRILEMMFEYNFDLTLVMRRIHTLH